MRVDGVLLDARCLSPPSAVCAHRTAVAASRFGAAGTQVGAPEKRSRGNVSPKVVGHRMVAAVHETRSASMPTLVSTVAFHVRRSARVRSVGSPLIGQGGPAAATHLTNCCRRHLTQPRRRSRSGASASNAAERHRWAYEGKVIA
jgi:hypothetical protein